MKPLSLILLLLALSGCAWMVPNLPKNGQSPTEKQIKKCERLGDLSIAMYGGGFIIGLGGFTYGVVSGEHKKVGMPVFFSGWAIGMMGLGNLYYMQNYTNCPMP